MRLVESLSSVWRSAMGRRLVFTVATSVLMLSDDLIQKLFNPNNLAQFELSYVVTIVVINALLWLTHRWFALVVTGLFASMQIAQLTHISVTGTPLAPYDIGKFFEASGEIALALVYGWQDHVYLFIVWLASWGAAFYMFARFSGTVNPWPSWVPLLLVVLILGSKPERATRRDMIAFMPGPTRSSLHNSINAFSYYFTRMAGRDQQVLRPDYLPYEVKPRVTGGETPQNIILLLVDSLRHDRLQVNGYERETTPFLAQLDALGALETRTGLASSVATGSSLPLLLNVVREPGNVQMINQHRANLFRNAQQAGYKTFWLSTQESKVLHALGARYIDVIKTLEDDPLDIKVRGDNELVTWLEEKEWGEKNFVVILSRSVHSPYEANYAKPDAVEMWSTKAPDLAFSDRMNNAYDNAILYFDGILERKITELKQSLPGHSVVVITADHGQMLGEQNAWGHNRLQPAVASVPILMHQWGLAMNSPGLTLPDSDYVSHYELGEWLLNVMQFELVNPQNVANVHYFQGEDLYRDNLYRRVLEDHRGFTFCDLSQVSRYNDVSQCQATLTSE